MAKIYLAIVVIAEENIIEKVFSRKILIGYY